MTKLVQFPKQTRNMTYGEGLEAMLKETSEEVKNSKVQNLLVIGFDGEEYNFGMLNGYHMRTMLGTMECVKAYFIALMDEVTEYEDLQDD